MKDVRDQTDDAFLDDVFQVICEELRIKSTGKVLRKLINQYIQSQKATLGVNSFEQLAEIEIRHQKVKIGKKIARSDAIQMMVYTISEMKIIMEEYREMQIFVKEANSEDL